MKPSVFPIRTFRGLWNISAPCTWQAATSNQIARNNLQLAKRYTAPASGLQAATMVVPSRALSECAETLCAVGVAYWGVSDFYGGAFYHVVGMSLVVSRTTAYLMLPVFSLCILAVCRRTITFLR